ncbi:MAG: hypothetical protein LBT55_01735 [Clostridiaceae bacterium]|jgi:hypothetical protein|nr:hypothetical protein [Clostridiaceae bacterium]
MYNYEIEIRKSGMWERLTAVSRPFNDGLKLDDALDEGGFKLSFTTSTGVERFARLRIKVYEGGTVTNNNVIGGILKNTFYRVVTNMSRTLRRFVE